MGLIWFCALLVRSLQITNDINKDKWFSTKTLNFIKESKKMQCIVFYKQYTADKKDNKIGYYLMIKKDQFKDKILKLQRYVADYF